MRLTLRTLLFWKDGMLPDDQAAEMAARVEASEAARGLAARIDEVASRPTLAAPAPDAPGFAAAANSTAEYLDNVLPADRLEEFEKVCFASDAQLAETAATHEILAAWCRAPAQPLDASARRRLLAEVRARANAAPSDSAGSPPTGRRPSARPAAKRAFVPASTWLLVAAAAILLVSLVGVLGWSLGRGGRARQVAVRAAVPRAAAPAAEPPAAAVPDPAPTPPAAADDAAVGAADPTAAAPMPSVAPAERPVASAEPPAVVPAKPAALGGDFPPVADAAPPGDATPAAPATPATSDQRVPQGDALAIAAPAPAPAAAPIQPAAPAPAAPAAPAVAGPAVLLHRRAGDPAAEWTAGAEGSRLELPADLVAPPFGGPAIVVDGLRISLAPGTRAELRRDADGTPRLEVIFGGASVAGGGRLGATAGGLAGVFAPGLAAPVDVEAALVRRPGGPPEATERTARIAPAGGRVEWRQTAAAGGAPVAPLAGIGAAVELPDGRALEWRSGAPDVAAVVDGGPPRPAAATPPRDPFDALAARALAGRLAAGTAAVPALRELSADRRVEARVAAAATLAMLGEFDEAARLLVADDPAGLKEGQWARLDAAAVQPALARGPRAAAAFVQAVAAHCRDRGAGTADTVVRLAHGLSDDELAAGGDADLVAALESPQLVVRRYAIATLRGIVGAAQGDAYRADWADGPAREKAVAWWRARLAQGAVRRGAPGR